jgi:acetyl-CoA synthetase
VLAYSSGKKFDPEHAFALLARHHVRNSFLPPTALKLMGQVPRPREHFAYAMRSIGSGGEALGDDILSWCRETFGFEVNEFYGQTEANLTVGNCNAVFPSRPRSMGRAFPGHEVEIIGPDGAPLPPGTSGIVAVRRNPVHMIEYWRDPAATKAKYNGDWLLTGDIATKDENGYFWYEGRDDDIISSGGYRIGPTDIEDCLIKHPGVLMAAAIGSPDPVRGEIIKAYILPRHGIKTGPDLAKDIQAFVRERLAAYQYPREVVFVEELPLTATGKIRRNALREQDRQSQRVAS